MSDYSKLVDYAAKDALTTGNPAKLVKGTELGAEFDAIATAVATKLDSSGDTDLAVADGGTGASTAADARTNLGLVIGTNVQAYDADTAKLDVAQKWTAPQRLQTAVTITDSGTIDLTAGQDFTITGLTGAKTLSFSNLATTIGQRGFINFANPSGHAISEGSNIYNEADTFTTISAAGTYMITYWVFSASSVFIKSSAAMS